MNCNRIWLIWSEILGKFIIHWKILTLFRYRKFTHVHACKYDETWHRMWIIITLISFVEKSFLSNMQHQAKAETIKTHLISTNHNVFYLQLLTIYIHFPKNRSAFRKSRKFSHKFYTDNSNYRIDPKRNP